MTHRWTAPVRPDLNTTFRSCSKCGLIKVSRHEPDNTPRHWVEYEIEGRRFVSPTMPSCEPGMVPA
jgi:hypothetical protein